MMELSAPAAAFCNSARQDAQFEEPIKLQYPVTQTSADHAVFAKLNTESGGRILDFSPLVDPTVIQIVPQTRLEQVHQIFLGLGLKLVLVCSFGELVGIITKNPGRKTFVHYLEDGGIGFIKKDPIVEETKPEAPAEKSCQERLPSCTPKAPSQEEPRRAAPKASVLFRIRVGGL
eukprot:s978_g6.t1